MLMRSWEEDWKLCTIVELTHRASDDDGNGGGWRRYALEHDLSTSFVACTELHYGEASLMCINLDTSMNTFLLISPESKGVSQKLGLKRSCK